MKTLIFVILAAVALVGALRLLSRKLLYFPVPMSQGRDQEIIKMGVSPLSATTDDGVHLEGWIMLKDADNLPFVYYFGGNAEEVSCNIEAFREQVPANVVLVNYRGYGRSEGRPNEKALKADSLIIFDKVAAEYGLPPERCVAWGRSLGSSIACFLCKERGLGRLILTCPFDSIEAVAATMYPGFLMRWILTDPHRTTDFSAGISSNTLILAAEADEIIPFERTRTLFDSLTCQKSMRVIAGAGHNTISDVPEYVDAVRSFFLSES